MKIHDLDGAPTRKAFFCPACGCGHWFDVAPGRWFWNGDYNKPTVTPSIRVYESKDIDDKGNVITRPQCHFFIVDGKIRYCEDSGHKLAGQTVEMEEF